MPSTTAAARLFSRGRITPRNPFCLASRASDRARPLDLADPPIQGQFACDEELLVQIGLDEVGAA